MNFTKQQKDTAIIVLAAFLLMAIAAYSFFGIYAPAHEAKLQMEQTLSSERDVLMALENQLKEMPEGEKVNPLELQQKVSVEPLTDLVLLQIEQAELISKTLVKSVGFAEGPFELLAPVEGVENIQEVLTTVEIEAPNYESITAFIEEIEAMKRIMVVDAITFSSPPEQTQQASEEEPLSVSLQFSAFYRPDLIALAETAPKVDAPAPANKKNPMPQNDGTDLIVKAEDKPETETEAGEEEEVLASSAENPNSNVAGAQTANYHKVEQGDTLSLIALKYYGSPEGEQWIMEANELTDSTIAVGTVLVIPEQP